MVYAARKTDTDLMVEQHMDLVRRIAHHLRGRLPESVQVDDLIQAGAIGLLEAIRNFEDRHGASFTTYAGIRIRGAILDEVRRQDWAPRSAYRDARLISEAIRQVELSTGREALPKEIASALGVDLTAYQRMLRKVAESRVLSLEAAFGPDQDFADLLESDGEAPFVSCAKEAFAAALAGAVEALPERERLVMSLYYDDELNLKEVGEVLGVTESRVCQLHGQALARLRARLSDWKFAEV
jgi:RNA polymerase sigma factor FliA